ncbi:uncharacterized protein TNCV_2532331 [Trichonephila clavipes]|nr:uncharacterized protein TNCV_2532331 [Trichonephila clavipes]
MARQKGNVMSQLARMTRKEEEREDALLTMADYLREHMLTLEDYRDRLRDLQRKEIYIGKGVEDKLEILTRFTDMLCNGSRSAASGAVGWGGKKALDKISGSGCKKSLWKGSLSKLGISDEIIEQNMKHEKGFRGVFTSDLLPKKMRQFENGIINLDIATGPGTHWVCYYNDSKNNFVEYFDPFGDYVSKSFLTLKRSGRYVSNLALDEETKGFAFERVKFPEINTPILRYVLQMIKTAHEEETSEIKNAA